MPGIDDYPETPKEPGSREALEWRKAERQDGRLNAPIRGVRGIKSIVAQMCGYGPPHKLECQCPECQPDEVRQWMAARRAAIGSGEVIVLPAQEAPKRKGRKWTGQRGRSGN